jgi:zinc protease
MLLLVIRAFAEPFSVIEDTLPNGVHLVAHTLETAADVAIRVYVPRGAALDPEGRAGLAHVVEHVSYTGSEHVSDYDGTLAAVGGTSDGWTTHDAMVFAVTVPIEGLEWAMFLESDRIGRSRATAESLRDQLAVIANERRDNARETATLGALAAALWPAGHPYARRVIGDEAALANLGISELQTFTKQLLHPAGVTVVMVGPDADVLMDAGRTWFGSIGSPLPEVQEPRKPGRGVAAFTQTPRRVWVPADVYPTRLAYGWIVSSDADTARWAAEVLAYRLAGEGVSAQAWYGREGASFTLMVTTHHPARTDRRVRRALARLAARGPSAAELEGARATAWTRAARRAETADGRADLIVEAVEEGRAPGLPDVAVAPAQVQAYAAEQLGYSAAVVVAVVPSTRPSARPSGMVRW